MHLFLTHLCLCWADIKTHLDVQRPGAIAASSIQRGIRCKINLRLLCRRLGKVECVRGRVHWVFQEKGTAHSEQAEEAACLHFVQESLEGTSCRYSLQLGGRAGMMQKVKEVYTSLGFSDGPGTEDPTQAEQRMSLIKGSTDHGVCFFPWHFQILVPFC